MKHLPNAITSLNLITGFIAVIFAARGDVVTAAWLLIAAMIFDFLDGFSARLLHAYSEIGKQLDSLADVVSFGVAPAMIIFHLLSNAVSPDSLMLMREDTGNTLILLLPSVMPVCAALRLARFNIDLSQSSSFRGLPTPANAVAVITLVLAVNFSEARFIKSLISSPVLLLAYTVTLSLLMVSRLHLFSLKIKSVNFRGNEGRYILLILVILCYLLTGVASLLLVIPFYIISSLIHYSLKHNTD